MKYLVLISFLFHAYFSGAQIRVDVPAHDFGNIFEDKGPVKTTFTLINPYVNDTIHLLNIETSCGCTAVLSKDTVIYPQNSIVLSIEYNPKGRPGLFDKSIKIESLTGNDEHNTLYLKIKGNVISKKNEDGPAIQLIEYKVAPIYFYPITQYDTSYLDYNFIIDFINELTYEIDYYKFTRVGFKITLRDKSVINDLSYLLRFVRWKFVRQLTKAGYGLNHIFFALPEFNEGQNFPKWAIAEVKAYSVSFNDDNVKESKIKTTHKSKNQTINYVLNYNSNTPLILDSIYKNINFTILNQRLLTDSILILNINYKTPESYNQKAAKKFKKKLNKSIFKTLKKSFGLKKTELIFNYDSTQTHASTKHYIQIWLNNDIKTNDKVTYKLKKDEIIQPLLPTYKEDIFTENQMIDTSNIQFKHFWNALLYFNSYNKDFKLIIVASTSHLKRKIKTDQLYFARQKSLTNKRFLEQLFLNQTGDTLHIEIKNVLQGPVYNPKEFKTSEYLQYEYVKLIPVFNEKRIIPIKIKYPTPYIVHYDYFFNGVDTNSFIFKRFADYLMYDIQTYGFVEVKTESSASHLPTNKTKSTNYMAYKHLYDSKVRINKYLKDRLIDPNRLLISEERILVQGIPYSKKTLVKDYKKYQYVTFVPTKYLE